MDQCQIVIPRNSAQIITQNLGDKALCEFTDINFQVPSYKRTYAVEVRRCIESEDYIEKIHKHVEKYNKICEQVLGKNLTLSTLKDISHVDTCYDPFRSEPEGIKVHQFQEQKYRTISELDSAFTEIKTDKDSLELFVLTFDKLKGITSRKHGSNVDSTLSIVNGVCLKKDYLRLKKTALRITKGNCVVQFEDLTNVALGVDFKKYEDQIIFVILVLGEKGGFMQNKVYKTASSFEKCKIYNIPDMDQEQDHMQGELLEELRTKRKLFSDSFKLIHNEITDILELVGRTETSKIEIDLGFMKKQRGIQETLNKMHVQGATLVAECWIPRIFLTEVNELVELKNIPTDNELVSKIIKAELSVLTQNLDETEKLECNPPSQFKQNMFTEVHQLITDTQGVPRQKEINPTIFNAITFPFMFGVMFGDIFHGTIVFVVALIVLGMDSRLKIGSFKYMLLQMGFWAMFMGWIYNDFSGISVPLFTSCQPQNQANYTNGTVIARTPDCEYPFGMDPIWDKSNEAITWYNSFKMKLAITIGIIQMIFGVFLRGLNAIQYKNALDFIFEFIPMILFISLMFGWFIVLIIYKWVVQTPTTTVNLINTLIAIPLSLGQASPATDTAVFSDYQLQSTLQLIILLVSMGSMPVLLLAKPIILSVSNKDHSKKVSVNSIYPLVRESHPHSFGELFVHQLIETIEFALGCVSNTASYLRLWALSLAHAELSATFINQTFLALVDTNFFVVMCAFIIFMSVTFGVLLCMDSLECFLHALRLHWVEFQNKFQRADGRRFRPQGHSTQITI